MYLNDIVLKYEEGNLYFYITHFIYESYVLVCLSQLVAIQFLSKYCMYFLFYKLKCVVPIISYITMPAHKWKLYEVLLKLVQIVLMAIINMDEGPN